MMVHLKMLLRGIIDKIIVSIYGDSYLFKRIAVFYRGYGNYYYNHGVLPKESVLHNELGLSLDEWLDENRAIDMLHKYWIREEEYESKWRMLQESVFRRLEKKEMFYSPEKVFQSSWLVKGYYGGMPFLDKEDFERLKKCLISLGEDTIIIAEEGKSGPFPIRVRLPVMITWEDLWKEGYLLATFISQDYSNFYIFGSKPIWGKYVATESDRMVNLIAFSGGNDSLLDSYLQTLDLSTVCFDGQTYQNE
jgi:hypothetical protein